MKKIGLFLLAVVMMVGVAGCSGGDDFSPTVSNMAGVYNLTKLTGTEGGVPVTLVPPAISGTINMTTAGTYTFDITVTGERFAGTGTYAISGDTIIFSFSGREISGAITDDGRKYSYTVDGMTYYYTKS